MFVRKVWRQSKSLAVVIPKEVCRGARIVEGSHVVMSLQKGGVVQFKRLFKDNGELNIRGSRQGT